MSVKDVTTEKQVDHILLMSGEEGLRKYNSWTLTNEEKKKPDVIWQKFLTQLEPKVNFRVARFYLQKFSQRESESIDDFVARCRLKAKECAFTNAKETQERLVEQLISGTRHLELQKELLQKDDTLTIDQAIDLGRTHEASLLHMKQMAEMCDTKAVNAITSKDKFDKPCRNCGRVHPFKPREKCPAWGTSCAKCDKPNHWASQCRGNKNIESSGHAATNSKPRQERERRHRRKGQKSKKVHVVYQDSDSNDYDSDNFDELSFSEITQHGAHDSRTEVFTSLKVKLPRRPGTHKLKVKVDTGAGGNTLPLRTFKQMFPEQTDEQGFPRSGATQPKNTILTAYNGSTIRQFGVISIKCRHDPQGEWTMANFFVVDTNGPAILGLPTSRQLQLITLHCHVDVQEGSEQPPIHSTQDLIKAYPGQFDKVGNFAGSYKIVIDPEIQPVIHAPRRCPIHIKDELKTELDAMVDQEIIRPITEPTDWVNSLTYASKANGKLRICLDPKDLNKAIRRCHHRTPTLEEMTHQLAGSKWFSKLDAKNGYWSVKLDEDSQKLTTFNSPFGRFCFVRMPFGLAMSQDVFQQKMDQIIEQCPGTLGIADDVAVYGRTEEEHDKDIHNLMKVTRDKGLMFNSEKCSIKQKKIQFFGMEYDEEGVHPDPGKVQDVQALSSPTSVTELQEILGIVTYMSPFIPKLSDMTAPLRGLIRQDADFTWTESHEEAFRNVKKLIGKQVTLTYFDPNIETVLQVDASQKGLGGKTNRLRFQKPHGS